MSQRRALTLLVGLMSIVRSNAEKHVERRRKRGRKLSGLRSGRGLGASLFPLLRRGAGAALTQEVQAKTSVTVDRRHR
jgi:hypothetical protein